MPKIFISHSSKDNDFAEKLASALRERGVDVWLDLLNIPAGTKWSTAIQQALKQCEAMLLIITPDSMESTNVEDEWQYYIDKKKPIIPIRWLPADVHFQLNRYQYVDFHEREFESALMKLGTELVRTGFPMMTTSANSPQNPTVEIRVGAAPESQLVETVQQIVREEPRIVVPDWVGKVIPAPFDWCVVPAGKVTLQPSGEDGDYLRQMQEFEVSEFQIARYPITNAQFEVFVNAQDGWRDAAWWDYSPDARAWRSENSRSESASFVNCTDCPRGNVTWYAAVAFTRWLSVVTQETIVLPTEQQWQRAARGDDERVYPWGNEWDASKCNSGESGIRKTTPVTRYPQGMSPFGLMDMSGNVWEWCATGFTTGSSYISGTEARVVRGGSWYGNRSLVRAVYRSNWDPDGWYDVQGFRVVCSLSPS